MVDGSESRLYSMSLRQLLHCRLFPNLSLVSRTLFLRSGLFCWPRKCLMPWMHIIRNLMSALSYSPYVSYCAILRPICAILCTLLRFFSTIWFFPVAPFGLWLLYVFFVPVCSCSWIRAPSSYQCSSLNFRLFLSELSSRNCYRTRNGYWKKSIWA